MEARCLLRFDMTAEQACFPCAQQAASLTRFIDRKNKPTETVESEWLISSAKMNASAMLAADRSYWAIENGLHLRLDVSAMEDKSRIRTPKAACNLAMFRRASISVAVHWMHRCKNKRQATLTGFFDAICANGMKKALSLITALKPSWLHEK
jgi:predicted transposase YbfD/YdcC